MTERAVCPECGSNETQAKYQHNGCPGSPTGTTTWEKEAEVIPPDGRPIRHPCPGCKSEIVPSYFYCRDCQHQWQPPSNPAG